MGSRSSTTDAPRRTLEDPVIVGIVGRPHGVRGEVTVRVLSDVEDRFAPGRELALLPPGVAPRSPVWLTVESARPHKKALLVGFEGVGDRDQAEALRGAELAVDVSESPTAQAEEDTWYHHQLLGCRCHDRQEGELGVVIDVLEDGGGAMLLVEGDDGRKLPIPLVKAYLMEVDLGSRRIELDLPEGLVETCTSKS